MINSIGLPNKGLEGFLAADLPQLAELPVPLVVSVMGFSRDELATLVARVAERDEVAMIELNVSCPNVETGLVMGADPAETARAVERVRPRADKPLIVKLTPNAADPAAVAAAAEAAGADAVSLVNTLKGMALDPVTSRPWLGGGTGGVSGPAIRAIALEQVHAVAKRVSIPVIGMGGIASGAHAADFLAAGATFVAVGTESFRDPAAGRRVATHLAADAGAQATRDHRLHNRGTAQVGYPPIWIYAMCGNIAAAAGSTSRKTSQKSLQSRTKTSTTPNPPGPQLEV